MTKIKIFFKKNFLFVLLLILIIPTFQALIRPGYFPMHDDMQAMRLLQMDKCVKDRQIPCRWVPDMGFGYGYPQFNYYAPLPYYIMETWHIAGMGYLDSVKVGFALSFVLSGVGMYLLGTSLIFLPFLISWITFLILGQKLHLLPDFKKRIVDLVAGLAWGFGLSAFFTLPAFFERNLVHIKTLTGGYFGYLAHFVS